MCTKNRQEFGSCLAYLFYQANYLYYTITPADIPNNSPVQLNTSDPNIQALLPVLYSMYPNYGMELIAWASQAPYVVLNSSLGDNPCAIYLNVNWNWKRVG